MSRDDGDPVVFQHDSQPWFEVLQVTASRGGDEGCTVFRNQRYMVARAEAVFPQATTQPTCSLRQFVTAILLRTVRPEGQNRWLFAPLSDCIKYRCQMVSSVLLIHFVTVIGMQNAMRMTRMRMTRACVKTDLY